ncbi:uncharacterized [Tachysurus ichikawai]
MPSARLWRAPSLCHMHPACSECYLATVEDAMLMFDKTTNRHRDRTPHAQLVASTSSLHPLHSLMLKRISQDSPKRSLALGLESFDTASPHSEKTDQTRT